LDWDINSPHHTNSTQAHNTNRMDWDINRDSLNFGRSDWVIDTSRNKKNSTRSYWDIDSSLRELCSADWDIDTSHHNPHHGLELFFSFLFFRKRKGEKSALSTSSQH